MELFKLFGRIAVENDEANEAIDETTDIAERSQSKIGKAFEKIGNAFKQAFTNNTKVKETSQSLKDLTETCDKQESELLQLKQKYQDLYLTQGKNSTEAKDCAKEIDKLSSELKENKQKLNEAEKAADKFDNSLDDVSDSSESASSRMNESFKKIGTAVATYFAVDKIIDFGKQAVDAAATVAAEASAFEQIMGSYSDTATKKMNQIADNTGMVATRLTPYMTSMTAKFKGLGYDITDATDLASDGLNVAADAAAFWDMSLDESVSHLNSFINGSYEGGEAIGLFANDTQMAAFAVEQGLIKDTKAWASLDEATKQATRLEYAQNMQKASGAVGQAAKEADQYANVQANLTEKWRQFKAQIGEPLLQNVVNPAMEKLSGLVDVASTKFQELSAWVSKHKTLMENLAIVIGSVGAAILLYNTYQGIATALTTAKAAADAAGATSLWAYAAAQTAALAPIVAVVAAIAAVIAIIVLCIKHWDKIKNTTTTVVNAIKTVVSNVFNSIKTTISNIINSVKSTVETVFNAIKSAISTPLNAAKSTVFDIFNSIKTTISNVINSAKSIVQKGLDSIKGFFDKLKIKFPNIKLPHFSIKGEFSLDPPSVPKLGIEWYAKGGILNSPTAFGINPNSGKTMVGGEAGAEAVAPIDILLGYIRTAVSEQNSNVEYLLEKLLSMLAEFLPDIVANSNKKLVLPTGELVAVLAPEIDDKLGEINIRKGRGN